ncbi:hypothetical protein AMS68_003966 [Peltaster fructicola]|uniref:Swi5-domain-containing protein n=1 Tax=Peltaster fructicola TaxID=286661 RepID=A0A6H0XUZ4_9PEZI|nr:hypothetical protein AMS68_003966 [Peltaster fructicola]
MQTQADAKLQRLHDTLAALKDQRDVLAERALASDPSSGLKIADDPVSEALRLAKKTNQEHIRLLNQYNEIKDVATSLIGMIAENRQKRIIEVMQDFDVDEND